MLRRGALWLILGVLPVIFTLSGCGRGHLPGPSQAHQSTLGSVKVQAEADFLRLTLFWAGPILFEQKAVPGGYDIIIAPALLGESAHGSLIKESDGSLSLPPQDGPATSLRLIPFKKDRRPGVRVEIRGEGIASLRLTEALAPTRLILDVIGQGAIQPDAEADELGDLLSAMSGDVTPETPKAKERRLVVVDAGHGGFEPGATGPTGVREKDINLAVALALKEWLQDQPGVDVILTRETDVFLRLGERASFANDLDADLFISIHANGALRQEAHGIETYYLDTASDAAAARLARFENTVPGGIEANVDDSSFEALLGALSIEGRADYSRSLALATHRALVSGVKGRYPPDSVRDLGVKTALFYVLVETRMPGILLELSFVSNPLEEQRLADPAFHRIAAEAIGVGILDFFSQSDGLSWTGE